MSVAEELTFHLEDFDGPLELLLALVAKHKMDLHNIPILELIDQYTRTVEQADPDPEAASAFIEMAARLVEMKSYLLLPRSEEGERLKQEFTGQLIDCRHAPSADDIQMLHYLHYHNIPFVVALTKADKLKKSQLTKTQEEFEKLCLPYGCQKVVLTSGESGYGIPELQAVLNAAVAAEYEANAEDAE